MVGYGVGYLHVSSKWLRLYNESMPIHYNEGHEAGYRKGIEDAIIEMQKAFREPDRRPQPKRRPEPVA